MFCSSFYKRAILCYYVFPDRGLLYFSVSFLKKGELQFCIIHTVHYYNQYIHNKCI